MPELTAREHGPQINNAVNLSSNGIKCGDEFEKLLQQVNEETDIAEMNNLNTVVVDYSCEKTDTQAEMYDTAMLEKYDMHGGRNVFSKLMLNGRLGNK